MPAPIADPAVLHSQITIYKNADERIQTGEAGPMRWRSWLLRERERLRRTWVWRDVFLSEDGDSCALFGVLSDRAAELMALPGGKS